MDEEFPCGRQHGVLDPENVSIRIRPGPLVRSRGGHGTSRQRHVARRNTAGASAGLVWLRIGLVGGNRFAAARGLGGDGHGVVLGLTLGRLHDHIIAAAGVRRRGREQPADQKHCSSALAKRWQNGTKRHFALPIPGTGD